MTRARTVVHGTPATVALRAMQRSPTSMHSNADSEHALGQHCGEHVAYLASQVLPPVQRVKTGHAHVRHTSCTTSEQAAWVYDGLRWRCRLRRVHLPIKQLQKGRLHPPSPAPHLLQVHLLGPGSQMKAWVADSHGAACVQVGLRGVFRVATECSG